MAVNLASNHLFPVLVGLYNYFERKFVWFWRSIKGKFVRWLSVRHFIDAEPLYRITNFYCIIFFY